MIPKRLNQLRKWLCKIGIDFSVIGAEIIKPNLTMIIVKLLLAIVLAFIVFISTTYFLSRLFFEKINLDDYMKKRKRVKTSNING